MDRTRPAVLDVREMSVVGRDACHYFCGARHRQQMGVCTGFIEDGEVEILVWLNSLWSGGDPVPICRPCAEAWPDIDLATA
jgi:hypothetical protein